MDDRRIGTRLQTAAALVALCIGLVVVRAPTAGAASFTVNPVQIFLSAKAKSAVLTLRNVSTEPLRFQLSVFAWDQSPLGELLLTPTRDVIFFPPLLSLAPGEQRNVRLGATVSPAAVEKTYRIFVEELPPAHRSEASASAGEVRVLTRMGIPIFIQPAKSTVDARLEGLTIQGGRLSFRIRNAGTVHVVAQAVRFTGSGPGGETVLEGALEGWYILPGGTRVYDLELPRDTCPRVRRMSVEVQTSNAVLSGQLSPPAGACGQ